MASAQAPVNHVVGSGLAWAMAAPVVRNDLAERDDQEQAQPFDHVFSVERDVEPAFSSVARFLPVPAAIPRRTRFVVVCVNGARGARQ